MRQPRWRYHSLKGKRRPTPQVSANYVQVLAFLNYLFLMTPLFKGCDITGDIV